MNSRHPAIGRTAAPPRRIFALAWGLAGVTVEGTAAEAVGEAGLPVLTNLAQVIAPGRSGEPPAPYPVRVRGVITQMKGWVGRWITIHDGTNGCAVQAPTSTADLRAGQWVEVEGELGAEPHFSYVAHPRITVLGEGVWPEPQQADAAKLARGDRHAGWVKLQGSVLDIVRTDGKLVYLIGSGLTGFNLWVEEPIDALPLHQLNATVEVCGVAWSVVSGQARRPSRFTLHAGGQSNIVVLSAGSSNQWSRPAITIKQFAEAAVSNERRVVHGTVTYVNPAGMFIMEDGTEEAYVNFLDPIPTDNKRAQFVPRGTRPRLQPGDRVEVVCTKRRSRSYSPWLEWAEARVVGKAEVPEATLVTPEEILTGQPDCRQVRLRARVFDYDQFMQGDARVSRLLVQVGDRTTYVVFASDRHVDFGALVGREVEMRGVPVISSGNSAAVRSFTFYLSDPADARLVPPLPMWRNPTVRKVTGAIGAAALVAGAWIFFLRRQVTARTAELAASNGRLRRNEQELQRALVQEQELHQLRANFVSMVSHEFRTPLGVIVSSTDILRRYFDRLEPEMRREQLAIIQRSTGALSGLIEDLLLLGKAEAGKLACQPVPIDLRTFCGHLADEAASATKHACPIEVAFAGEFAGAEGDDGLLRPALTNLLTNAVKYSPPGAPVGFRISRRHDQVEFVIEDRGIGIPAADQSRLFAAFSRGANVGERAGTGLGLVIAKRCVELHGGRIEFHSTEGAGTTFTVTLSAFKPSTGTAPTA